MFCNYKLVKVRAFSLYWGIKEFLSENKMFPLCIKYLVLKFELNWSNDMHVADRFVTLLMVIRVTLNEVFALNIS